MNKMFYETVCHQAVRKGWAIVYGLGIFDKQNYQFYKFFMFRQSKKIASKAVSDATLLKIQQQQKIFHKVSRAFTTNQLRPSEHHKIVLAINQRIKRPQTSSRLKKDYKDLMDLADCNKKVFQSRQRSMRSYKKMKTLNQNQAHKKYYKPLFEQIQNTEGNLCKRKFKRYDLRKYQNQMHNKSQKQPQIQQFVENTLFEGIKEMKNNISIEAKLHKKLCIFGELLAEQKQKHINQIKIMLLKQKEKTPNMNKNLQIYLINHYLVQKLMMKIYEDSSFLQHKKRNSQTYEQIKNQMVSQIIKEKGFGQVLRMMEIHCQNQQQERKSARTYKQSQASSSSMLKAKMAKINKKHQRFGSEVQLDGVKRNKNNKAKQNEIAPQFYRFYEIAQQKLNDAKLELDFVTSRRNNVFSMIEIQKEQQNQIIST